MTAKEKAERWLEQSIDENTRQGIISLLAGSEDALEDAFYKDLEFGTGGMRGVMGVGSNRVNKYTFGSSTQGLANYLNTQFPSQEIKVAITHDCRHNSPELARMAAEILSANEIKVYLTSELRPTPLLSYAVRHYGCQSGIVITASHNPPEYNGYKVYWEDGAQIVAPHDAGIINEVKAIADLGDIKFTPKEDLIITSESELDEAFYADSLKQRVSKSQSSNLKVVFTSLHGTSITMLPELLSRAGYSDVHVVEEQATPDGDFPTVDSPNPEEREALNMALELADKVKADLVIGTDPDSDRIGVAVRDGDTMTLLNGNQCGVLLTDYLLDKSELQGNEFIGYTIVSSDLFGDVASHYGAGADVCLTGFKHIAKLIRDNEGTRRFVGGGEESYGYMVGDFVRDKDALTSALLFCDLLSDAKSSGKSGINLLEEIFKRHGVYQERLISLTKKGRDGSEQIRSMMEAFRNDPPSNLGGEKVVRIDDINSGESRNMSTGELTAINLPSSNVLQFYTESGSKISARPSGTEPKIKFYFSARSDWQNDLSLSEQQKILNQHIDAFIEDLRLS
ncbi:MAG: phospho-sugar mutase [Flavobacteriales bacterium]|jgi:phosphoglucomutase|nr:phospho-sugar mutase [Flavobacteriales bacterium]NCG29844.1 phospho-sugar mutase [Bacteroidota bacterium]MBT3964498.1 phospho-sugar mutase [Flavobacteriales bacterium]MBT4705736.1 phospho-sugar mutase [Flavobacteriales bacterium]MBT4931012.1 phospho-sugar mutase [Flavobacteriales bacterium]